MIESKFDFADQPISNKLIGKNVLLMMKTSFTLSEVNIIEFTQHRVRVTVLGGSGIIHGLRKKDIVLFPLRTPRIKLNTVIKKAIDADSNLNDFIKQYGYNLEV